MTTYFFRNWWLFVLPRESQWPLFVFRESVGHAPLIGLLPRGHVILDTSHFHYKVSFTTAISKCIIYCSSMHSTLNRYVWLQAAPRLKVTQQTSLTKYTRTLIPKWPGASVRPLPYLLSCTCWSCTSVLGLANFNFNTCEFCRFIFHKLCAIRMICNSLGNGLEQVIILFITIYHIYKNLNCICRF